MGNKNQKSDLRSSDSSLKKKNEPVTMIIDEKKEIEKIMEKRVEEKKQDEEMQEKQEEEKKIDEKKNYKLNKKSNEKELKLSEKIETYDPLPSMVVDEISQQKLFEACEENDFRMLQLALNSAHPNQPVYHHSKKSSYLHLLCLNLNQIKNQNIGKKIKQIKIKK